VLFKTDPHGGMIVFQEDDSFEDGVRPARVAGAVSRSSGLDNRSGLRSPQSAGGRLFPKCPLRYEKSVVVLDKRVARVSKSAVYSKRRKLVLSGTATVRSKRVNEYTNSKGMVVRKLKFRVKLTRSG
jgi:hypothetical protein